MREIKFRVWEIRRKCFVNIPFLLDNGKPSSSLEQDGEYEYSTVKYGDCFEWSQYTGLKDKNGVEIYEGDIVEYGTSNSKSFYAECIFENAKFQWKIHDTHDTYNDYDILADDEGNWIEIIGNIYENPELLESK